MRAEHRSVERRPAEPGRDLRAWKQRLLLALLPASFGSEYRRSLLLSLDDALRDIDAGSAGEHRAWVFAWRRIRVWVDFFKTAALERCTALGRLFRHRHHPHHPQPLRSPRSKPTMIGLVQDLKYALRSLRKSPGFAVLAMATIALGIGATTSIFSVVNAVLLEPLPFDDAGRLVMIRGRWPVRGVEKAGISTGNLADFIRDTSAFDAFAALSLVSAPIATDAGDPEQVRLANVTPNFFSVVGIEPAFGRPFEPGDPDETVIVSYEFARRRFGLEAAANGDMSAGPEILGETLRIGSIPSTIVGVLPPGLIIDVPEQVGVPTIDTDVWKVRNWDLDPDTTARNGYFLRVFARLRPGVTMAQAQQEADAVAEYSRANFADAARVNTQFDVLSVHSQVVDSISSKLLVFMVAVGFVLLIACANVANLLLVRSTSRAQEVAVRSAMGAGRPRIARQMLLESLVLATAGAMGGVAIAHVAVRTTIWLDPAQLPRLHMLALDGTVLGFSFGLAFLTAMLFGLLPALRASGASINTVLRQAGPGTTGIHTRLGRSLIVGEVALSLVLLVGAGLLGRSFLSLRQVPPGFDADSVLTFRAIVPPENYQEFVDRLRGLPGVTDVAAMSNAPLSGATGRGPFVPDTISLEDTADWPASLREWVTPGYFEAMGIELIDGRTFAARDAVADENGQTPLRVVVDRRLADLTWPGVNPVGRTLHRRPVNQPEGPWQIVGVVETVRRESLRETGPGTIYFLAPARLRFVVRSEVPPESLVPLVRSELSAVVPTRPMFEVRTMASYVDEHLATERFMTILAAVFAIAALLLAAVGLYGVISYAVSQRMREMGVRLALGAQRYDLIRLVVGDGIRVALIGAAIGIVGALLVTQLLSAWLYGVTPVDPVTYVAITGLLVIVAVLACYLPAIRAAGTDPIVTLRSN